MADAFFLGLGSFLMAGSWSSSNGASQLKLLEELGDPNSDCLEMRKACGLLWRVHDMCTYIPGEKESEFTRTFVKIREEFMYATQLPHLRMEAKFNTPSR